MLLVAACHTYGEPVPSTVEKNRDFGEHPLIVRLASDEARVWSLFRGATWWLPLADAFFFQPPLPTDDLAMIGTVGGLRKELEKLNQLAWQADEDTILTWVEPFPQNRTQNRMKKPNKNTKIRYTTIRRRKRQVQLQNSQANASRGQNEGGWCCKRLRDRQRHHPVQLPL